MMIADYILAWLAVATTLYFIARLLRGPSEQRFARGVYSSVPVESATVTTRRGSNA
jgi:hypothetical protein